MTSVGLLAKAISYFHAESRIFNTLFLSALSNRFTEKNLPKVNRPAGYGVAEVTWFFI